MARPEEFASAKILVADDDPILREFAKLHLVTERIEVEIASDGGEAWTLLLDGKFDLAVVNLEMPVMDGYELMRRIRSHSSLMHLPIVVVTGLDDISSIDRAYDAGATAFAIKPLNWRVLAYQLSYALRDSRENERIRRKAKTLHETVRAQDRRLAACDKGLADLQMTLLENPLATASFGSPSIIGEEPLLTRLFSSLDALRRETFQDR